MKNRTIGNLISYLEKNFADQLSKSDINEIFVFLLTVDYDQISKMYDIELNENIFLEFERIVEKIKIGYPLAYLISHKFFFNHDFLVNENVLIPREDSEILVELANKFLIQNYELTPANVVDLGTGTGNLGLSVAQFRKNLDEYYLTDITQDALTNTTENVEYLKLNGQKIHLLKSNFLEVFEQIPLANLIISNPPYIDKNDLNIAQSVVQFEPNSAVFARNRGLDFYEQMSQNYQRIVDLNQPFMILMEFGFDQKPAIEQIFKGLPENHQIDFLKDNKGKWRAFKLYNKKDVKTV